MSVKTERGGGNIREGRGRSPLRFNNGKQVQIGMDNLSDGGGEGPAVFGVFEKSRDKVEVEMLFRVQFKSAKRRSE